MAPYTHYPLMLGLPQRRYPYLPSPRRRSALVAAARLFHPGIRCDIQSFRDPLPGLVDLLAFFGELAGRFRRLLDRGSS